MKSKAFERSETGKIGEYGNSVDSPLNWNKQKSYDLSKNF